MSAKMSRMNVIPGAAWIVALALIAVLAAVLWYGPLQHERELREWPVELRVALIVFPALFAGWYALLVGFIYGDAKRRNMRQVMWAWLALVPWFLGVIAYFILRDPLPTPCPKCNHEVPRSFAYCPICGASVHPSCKECGKQLEENWASCPHCGTRVAKPVEVGTPAV